MNFPLTLDSAPVPTAPPPTPFRAVALTANVLRHRVPTPSRRGGEEFADFVVDLESIRAASNVVVDYNHSQDEPIGRASISVEGAELIATGELTPFLPDDRACEIAAKSRLGVPFGVSPTFDFVAATRIDVEPGETIAANGRVYSGPLVLYRDAPLLGVSVCPYPTDGATNFETLGRDRLTLLTLTLPQEDKMAEDDKKKEPETAPPTELEDENGSDAPAKTFKNAELQEYVDKFGLELGVQYYQDDVPLADATAEAFQTLRSENDDLRAQLAKLSSDAPDGDKTKEDDKSELEADVAPDDEKNSELAKLRRAIETQGRTITSLKRDFATYLAADSTGVSPSAESAGPTPPKTYRDAFIAALTK